MSTKAKIEHSVSRPGNSCSGRHSCCFQTDWKRPADTIPPQEKTVPEAPLKPAKASRGASKGSPAAWKGSPPHTASPKPAKAYGSPAAWKGSPPHTASPKPAKAYGSPAAWKGSPPHTASPKPAKAYLPAACKGFLHFQKETHTLFFSHPSVQHGPSRDREVVPIGILSTFLQELLQVPHGFDHARVLADPPEVAVEGVDLVGLPPVADDRHFASPARAVLLSNLGC